MIRLALFCLILTTGVISTPIKNKKFGADSCALQACHPISEDKINVHLIPHSHDDVGWLKTVEQYFYGMRSDIQRAGVQYIISSTVEALKQNPNRRFVQVETHFFWRWWSTQDDTIKQDFVDLVNRGQIEIINAAWSMNDEACANYQSTIDQFTWGLRIINDTVGPCGIPRIGWQIDPFGHSREQASIFSQLGFDGVFFARLDMHDKENRKTQGALDYLWQGSVNLDNSEIFGNIFPEFYGSPSGFCWDIECGDAPINDDPESPDYNVDQRVNELIDKIKSFLPWYPTKNILIPMGGDFQYQAAEMNYLNMDKLLKAFENNTEINLIYSTPSCYIKAVNDANPKLRLKTDDFFPYGDNEHSYWTGYFTSRPNSKRFERTGNNILQAAKQLVAFIKIQGDNDHDVDLRQLREAMGIMQHHDAITGTEKQHVLSDYTRILDKAIWKAESNLGHIVSNLLKKDPDTETNLDLSSCLLSNISVCESGSLDRIVVAVQNPLSRPVSHYIRLPVSDGNYIVTGPEGEVQSTVVNPISDFSFVHLDDNYDPSQAELVFEAKDLPPLGLRLYYIQREDTDKVLTKMVADDLVFGTEEVGFTLDGETNFLKTVTLNGKTVEVSQEFLYYDGNVADNNNGNMASGAYIFRPLENTVAATPITDSATIGFTTKTDLVDEVQQNFNDWVKQIIRVYKGEGQNYIEFDWLVGPIDVNLQDNIGKEIITRFTVNDINNNGVFYTDSNGREMMRREKDLHPGYTYDPSLEPIASNYYPVTSKIVIRDEEQNLELAVLNDRSQGGSSLNQGQVELMVHRRLLHDDAKGVGEALNETEFGDNGMVARGQHYLVLGPIDEATSKQERELAQRKLLAPVVLVASAISDDLSLENIQDNFNFEFSPLTEALPEYVHILTLESWKDDTYILRLENILEKNEGGEDVTVDLSTLFNGATISDIRETTLGANQWLDEYNEQERYVWETLDGARTKPHRKMERLALDSITLTPMQIRTFIITITEN